MNRTRKVFLAIMASVVMLFAAACGKKDSSSFKHGSWSGNTYTSKFLGIKLQLGSDWAATSDEFFAMALGIPDMSESNIQTAFSKTGTITEMTATKSNGSYISITVTDITCLEDFSEEQYEDFSEKQYIENAIEHIESEDDVSGFSISAQKSKVDFLGKSTDCIEMSFSLNGQAMYELQIPIIKSHYIASISFNAYNKAELYTLPAMTSAI